MTVVHKTKKAPVNVEATMSATVETHKEISSLNTETTFSAAVKGDEEILSRNAVADAMEAITTNKELTSEKAEPAPEINDTKHKSSYQKKKERREEKKQKKERNKQKKERNKEINRKIKKIDKVLTNQGSVWKKDSDFRKKLDQESKVIFDASSGEQSSAIWVYTADEKKSMGGPYYKTMNSILRNGVYKRGNVEEMEFPEYIKFDETLKKSQQSNAVGADGIHVMDRMKLYNDTSAEVLERTQQNNAVVPDGIEVLDRSKLYNDTSAEVLERTQQNNAVVPDGIKVMDRSELYNGTSAEVLERTQQNNAVVPDGIEVLERLKINKDMVNKPVEKTQQNFDAVTHCIDLLDKSKLHKDMVFRRGTNLQTLGAMMGMKQLEDKTAMSALIKKKIDKFNEGDEIVYDRGFLSTAPFEDAGLPDEVEWRIQGHAGDKALFIANNSQFEHEGETLFQAGTIFRLLKICPPETEKNQTNWRVYMETVHID